MPETERLTVTALAARLGAKTDSVRKRLIRIRAGKAKPWPWLAGMERSNSGEWVVLVDAAGLVPDLSRTSEGHLADLRSEVEAARAQINELTRLLDREMTDRRALQETVDHTRDQLHRAQIAAATAEARLDSAVSQSNGHAPVNGHQPANGHAEDPAPDEAMPIQLARLWQRWWWGAMPANWPTR